MPVSASYLRNWDLSQVFRLLDRDDNCYLEGAELDDMFRAICGDGPVEIVGAEDEYTLESFRDVVERMNLTYPTLHVAENLMKYIRAKCSGRIGQDEQDALCAENCGRLFSALDTRGTGVLDLVQLFNMFKFMGIPVRDLINVYSEDGQVTPQEFVHLLQDMEAKYPQLGIDDKVIGFLRRPGVLSGQGAPDLAGVVPSPQPLPARINNRRAVLVGINYLNWDRPIRLSGCINDALNMNRLLLEHFSFQEDEILVLKDDEYDRDRTPTSSNIRRAFEWLFDGAGPGDLRFFHYSGHGSQVTDLDHNEADGQDECICPTDYIDNRTRDHAIVDDELWNVFSLHLPEGVNCVCFFDCCHSGTVTDLQCVRDLKTAPQVQSRYLRPLKTFGTDSENKDLSSGFFRRVTTRGIYTGSSPEGIESFPPNFAFFVAELARTAGLWTASQIKEDARGADERFALMDDVRRQLVTQGVLCADVCQQLLDMAASSAAVALCEVMGFTQEQERRDELRAARAPRPLEVAPDLWRRTLELFEASARRVCLELSGAPQDRLRAVQRDIDSHLQRIGGQGSTTATASRDGNVQKLWAFSGCMDDQTSADATINGVPQGACTWSFLSAMKDMRYRARYEELLTAMRKTLRGRYEQIPQLSTTSEDNFRHWFLEMEG
eukprot:CAMPEP_0117546988 /NCGR_PEP_ID=MMETSP0784-20121206/46890_1 /TAXON_ID=39447 /ORGANISM="" /LENGTH=661 /DNA_ID=CAMNT_0005343875 /DNA_START=77 /DNA_END=2062 /DNA_ORIENTATION=-